ncbi:MAG: UDP-N-acetylmuramate dehydrogenase [Acidobacteriota bacterium]|jgi:UDP-N-acetylmuramate dehydrogenase|nr:UDP-N-acetylmuramate dehydrogenase [Acidobacteriota bacterium]
MIDLARRLSMPGITCSRPDRSGRHTTFGIGGMIAMSVQATTRPALVEALLILKNEKIPHVMIGAGSNTVFADTAPDLVLVINRTRGIRRVDSTRIVVQSGEPNLSLMAWCARNGFASLEFLAGIPGSVGGAVAVNAGAFGQDMAAAFSHAVILDGSGRQRSIGADECGFRYRDSILKRGDSVLLEITLNVQSDDPQRIRQRMRSHFLHRRKNHPAPNARTAGCFFKNPRRDPSASAGRLIDSAGLRGWSRDGLEVSSKHANFIVNTGDAGMAELEAFVRHIIETVEKKHGIRLEREVLFVAADGRRY